MPSPLMSEKLSQRRPRVVVNPLLLIIDPYARRRQLTGGIYLAFPPPIPFHPFYPSPLLFPHSPTSCLPLSPSPLLEENRAGGVRKQGGRGGEEWTVDIEAAKNRNYEWEFNMNKTRRNTLSFHICISASLLN